MSTANFRMPSGKFKGHLITRVPPSYLTWMISVGHELAFKAKEELDRRGTRVPVIEVSAHAIDRGSQRLMHRWIAEQQANEGLYSWMSRKAEEAFNSVPDDQRQENMKINLDGIIWVIECKFVVPVLKSVWIDGEDD